MNTLGQIALAEDDRHEGSVTLLMAPAGNSHG